MIGAINRCFLFLCERAKWGSNMYRKVVRYEGDDEIYLRSGRKRHYRKRKGKRIIQEQHEVLFCDPSLT
jgi:hypothetical protein